MTPSSLQEHSPQQVDDTIPIAGSKRTLFDFGEFDHSSIPLEREELPVIIVGSSMVGMTLGVLLGYHGVKSISFDRHPSTAIHPRAALFLLRTLEIFRQLGLDEAMERESASNFDLNAGMIMVEQLVGGKTIFKMQESDPAEVAKVSPAKRLWLTQNMFEPLLRDSAKKFGAQQEFSTVVVHYEEVDDGVIVVVQDESKRFRKYKTKYLVATDGNRSATRRKEAIAWSGPGVLAQSISVNFTADLTQYLGTRAVHGVTYVRNSKIDAGFRLDNGGKGGFMLVTRAGDQSSFTPDSITGEEARQYFYDASGLTSDQVSVTVDSISYWSVAAFNSDRFSNPTNRVFIAGDAAHVMPPTGGMGGNTGIQDVYNLAWKLAYVVNGKASHTLLESYTTERQPIAGFTVQQAFSRLQKRVFQTDPDVPELPDIVCEIGYRYAEGALIADDSSNGFDKLWEDPYAPLVAAGSRLPHIWLENALSAGITISTLDLVKTNFVLLVAEEASPWIDAARSVSPSIDAYILHANSSPYSDPKCTFKDVANLMTGQALLVRPDSYVAWRAPNTGQDHVRQLQDVLERLLRPA